MMTRDSRNKWNLMLFVLVFVFFKIMEEFELNPNERLLWGRTIILDISKKVSLGANVTRIQDKNRI
jgi:hypothetical protein